MNTDHENFQDALLRYQGKESTPIPEEVFIRLDEYFTENNGITAERAKQLPLIKQGNGAYIREGTSRIDDDEGVIQYPYDPILRRHHKTLCGLLGLETSRF